MWQKLSDFKDVCGVRHADEWFVRWQVIWVGRIKNDLALPRVMNRLDYDLARGLAAVMLVMLWLDLRFLFSRLLLWLAWFFHA